MESFRLIRTTGIRDHRPFLISTYPYEDTVLSNPYDYRGFESEEMAFDQLEQLIQSGEIQGGLVLEIKGSRLRLPARTKERS